MKKKLGVLALAGAMAICPTACWAEETTEAVNEISAASVDIDLSSYTLEQLVELRNAINDRLAEALGSSGIIGKGTYEAGVDIGVGYYEITCSKNSKNSFINVSVFPTREDYDNYENEAVSQIWINDEDPASSERATINLVDGNILDLSGEGVIQAVKPAWAP